jgi:hypothetical protein
MTAFLEAGDRRGSNNLSSDVDMTGTIVAYARCRTSRG